MRDLEKEAKTISDLGFSQYQGKPKKNQPKTPNEAQGRDFFQTPNYAVDLLVPYIPENIKDIWECAAGEGKIAQRVYEKRYNVFTSDIVQSKINRNTISNFILDEPPFGIKQWLLSKHPFCIITNPPFSLKKEFFYKCVEYNVPFALLIPFDMNIWLCEAFDKYDCKALVPNRRIDYITPTGKSGATGNTAYYHSFWLTRSFSLLDQLTIVELSKEDKKNI